MAILLLTNTLAIAANIDFNEINNNVTKNCTVNQANISGTAENALSSEGNAVKNAGAVNNDIADEKPCADLKTEKKYVEPKFSTAKPRGQ